MKCSFTRIELKTCKLEWITFTTYESAESTSFSTAPAWHRLEGAHVRACYLSAAEMQAELAELTEPAEAARN